MRNILLNADYLKKISVLYKETHSLQKTAEQIGIAYGKVRKVLITLGEYETEFSLHVSNLKNEGFSISEISAIVGATEKRVNAFLPYEKGIYEGPILTADAKKSKKYRKLIQIAFENNVIQKYTPKKEQSRILGGQELMKKSVKNDFYPVCLHLELQNDSLDEEGKRVLIKYADATEIGTLTRDILIPSDMPLHNLHYVIQKLYGWQNSHLRCFKLEEKDYARLTGGMFKGWMDLVGIVFKGIPKDEMDAFWDDEYNGGSFKVWLKKKYNGPYTYGGYTENYTDAKESVIKFVERFPEVDVREPFHEYYNRKKEKKDGDNEQIRILKRDSVLNLTIKELSDSIIIEGGIDNLLERLKVNSVLGTQNELLANSEHLKEALEEFLHKNIDIGIENPEISPIAHKLIYNYDYGDNWIVEITKNPLESINISKEELNHATKLLIDKHKPVCISKKGGFVLDDVGGMYGYADFLRTIYEGTDRDEKIEHREWAESLGWSSRNVSIDKML